MRRKIHAWGGSELNLLSQLRVIEALSIADSHNVIVRSKE